MPHLDGVWYNTARILLVWNHSVQLLLKFCNLVRCDWTRLGFAHTYGYFNKCNILPPVHTQTMFQLTANNAFESFSAMTQWTPFTHGNVCFTHWACSRHLQTIADSQCIFVTCTCLKISCGWEVWWGMGTWENRDWSDLLSWYVKLGYPGQLQDRLLLTVMFRSHVITNRLARKLPGLMSCKCFLAALEHQITFYW